MPKPDLKVQKAASFLQCPFVAEEIAEALSSTCPEVLDLREAPGTIIPYHSHPEDKTIVVLEGVLRLNVEERLTVVEEGDGLDVTGERGPSREGLCKEVAVRDGSRLRRCPQGDVEPPTHG